MRESAVISTCRNLLAQPRPRSVLVLSLTGLLLLGLGAFESFQYFTRPRPPAGVALSAYKPPPEHPMTRHQAAERVKVATISLAPRPRISLDAGDRTALPTVGGANPSLATASVSMARPAEARGGEGDDSEFADAPSPVDNPAYRIPLARVGLPLLEQQRAKEVAAAPTNIKIITGFPCSENLKVTKLSPTHFVIDMDTQHVFRNWFLFHIEGITKPTTIRIDLANSQLWKWSTLNPVYSYVTDLNDPASFQTTPVKDPQPTVALNGPILPDTRGQKWHFISQVWIDQSRPHVGTLYTVQTFEKDTYVAMKYPYTPEYNHAWLASLKGNPHVKVMTVGKSAEGRPLQIVQIGDGDPTKTPCVLIYAREHACETDSSWTVEGAIRFLISEDSSASRLRGRLTFLLLPLFDPDGAASSINERIIYSFTPQNAPPEAMAYATWFEKWIDAKNRLDVVLDLHNMESGEMPHLRCFFADADRVSASRDLHAAILREFDEAGNDYQIARRMGPAVHLSTRLGGWLENFFGPLNMLYEINSQAPHQHLDLSNLRKMGQLLALAASNYFGSESARTTMDTTDRLRRTRANRVAALGGGNNAIDTSYRLCWSIANVLPKSADEIGQRGTRTQRK